MDAEFDPVRCAELHNELLAKAISHIPGATEGVRRDVLDRWHDIPPGKNPNNINIPEESPLHTFFSLIHSFSPYSISLTAEFIQPMPEWFDSEMHMLDLQTRGHPFILLYGDDTNTPNMDGGLYFNLVTNLVCWARIRDQSLPPESDWIPLQVVLEKTLGTWECGKFYWDPEQRNTSPAPNGVCYKTWIPLNLERAISNWERLLSAIQDRLPLPAQLRNRRSWSLCRLG